MVFNYFFALVYILSILIIAYFLFPKKDGLFVIRILGIFVSLSTIFYVVIYFCHLINHFYYYPLLSVLVLIGIIIFYYHKNKLVALPLKKPALEWKSLLIASIIFFSLLLVCFSYYQWEIAAPRYISIDAPKHFEKSRLIVKDLSNHLFLQEFGSFFVFSQLSPFKSSSDENILRNFQLFNILLFCSISSYLALLARKYLLFRSSSLFYLAASMASLGFVFNLFIMGFVPQLIGLLILLTFFDVYFLKYKNIAHWILLALIFFALVFCYIYWIPILFVLMGLDLLRSLSASNDKKNILIKTLPFIILLLYIGYAFGGVLRVLGAEGETYKVFLANFLVFIPFFFFALYSQLKKSLLSNPLTLLLTAAAVFFGILYSLYRVELASSYTMAKSLYLLGPLFYIFSIFGIDQLSSLIQSKRLRIAINSSITGILLVYLLLPFCPAYVLKSFEQYQALEKHLIESLQKENLMNPAFRPLDIFHFNAAFALYPQTNRLENFIILDRTKLDFIEQITRYLKEESDSNKKLYVIGDPKTSFWFYKLSGVKNANYDDLSNYDRIIMDYPRWQKEHDQPYIAIFETQTAQKWYWVNQETFHLSDFDIIYQSGQNLLLKYKG